MKRNEKNTERETGMHDIDYKGLFDLVFENAAKEEIGCFLRNEEVPFEYCRRALKMKGIGWENKLLIAKRDDCPMSILLQICKTCGERFVERFLIEKKNISDDILRELHKKDWTCYSLSRYPYIPDDIKRNLIMRFCSFEDDGTMTGYSDQLASLLEHQYSIPVDCWGVVDKACEIYRKNANESKWCYRKNICDIVTFMRSPVDEEVAVAMLDKYSARGNTWGYHWMTKLAANPSISDYVIMELRVKTPEAMVDEIEWLLNKNDGRREEWRKSRGE